ncbi:polysaccharide biosynthesis protein [Leptothoe spongobia TAU-MAC 1115]|uniref:Polysaccharide biosynthesis protein n=2 Tax=Leptothoe TaxID=2651725 RepID=A0A947DEP8_9CYAN|nr:polysaccharide biosynthesis protein [Leptothoe spongobia TAU-MAC 1115]
MSDLNSHSAFWLSLSLKGDRQVRKLLLMTIDIVTLVIALYLAIATRLESYFPFPFISENIWQTATLPIFQYYVFQLSGLYRISLRHSNLFLVRDLAKVVAISTSMLLTLSYFFSDWILGKSVLIIDALFCVVLLVIVRLGLRWFVRAGVMTQKRRALSEDCPKRLLIYGAGSAGVALLQALFGSHLYKVVGFVDDDIDLQRYTQIEGRKVYSLQQLPYLWDNDYFDVVALAIPSASQSVRCKIFEDLSQRGFPVKTVPSLDRIFSGQVAINELHDIDVTALLGREEVSPNVGLLQKQIRNQVVLVTGAGGSIGSELCRQIIQQQPKSLILYELNEFALYQIHQELSEAYPDVMFVPCLGSVTDRNYLRALLQNYGVDTLYHSAAYKHVPLLESNIAKGVENNVLGTLSAAQSAVDAGVRQFVLISTDKAVRPTNIMGTTKRVAELTIQALSDQFQVRTRFSIVRFGNVLGSSGSVVPRFRQQIAQGGPITLTHPEVTRFFMSIPEAARLVIQAGAMSEGGEVFLLDMGEPVKIYDLAARMIHLNGLIPDKDIAIKITGLRPGEKLYEELLIDSENAQSTTHPKIFCSQEYFLPWEILEPMLKDLIYHASLNDLAAVRNLLKELVPEYQPSVAVTTASGQRPLEDNQALPIAVG